jgi:hypothetical protein
MEKCFDHPCYHFSVDDVFDSLIEITDNRIPVFSHPFFKFLEELHDEFGLNVDLYLFYQKRIDGKLRTLKEIPEFFRAPLKDRDITWLRFGPHALDDETAPYSQIPEEQLETFQKIYSEIARISDESQLSKYVRLHYFSESYEAADFFISMGVKALFTTDKESFSYRMPDRVKKDLKDKGIAEFNGIHFIRSQFRAENFANDGLTENDVHSVFTAALSKYPSVIFFSHEYEFVRPDVRSQIVSALKILKGLNTTSV